jgi:hypothetical protein
MTPNDLNPSAGPLNFQVVLDKNNVKICICYGRFKYKITQ